MRFIICFIFLLIPVGSHAAKIKSLCEIIYRIQDGVISYSEKNGNFDVHVDARNISVWPTYLADYFLGDFQLDVLNPFINYRNSYRSTPAKISVVLAISGDRKNKSISIAKEGDWSFRLILPFEKNENLQSIVSLQILKALIRAEMSEIDTKNAVEFLQVFRARTKNTEAVELTKQVEGIIFVEYFFDFYHASTIEQETYPSVAGTRNMQSLQKRIQDSTFSKEADLKSDIVKFIIARSADPSIKTPKAIFDAKHTVYRKLMDQVATICAEESISAAKDLPTIDSLIAELLDKRDGTPLSITMKTIPNRYRTLTADAITQANQRIVARIRALLN